MVQKPQQKPDGALNHLRVLELGAPGATGAGMWLAGMGADVIKVEPPAGDVLRSYPPFANDIPGPERSLWHLFFNRNKRSIALDIASPADKARFLSLVQGADIVLESFQPGYLASIGLGYEDLKKVNSSIILVSLTTFGQTGPHSQYLGDDLIAMAASGYMMWGGDNTRSPVVAPAFQAYQLGGLYGAFATLIANRRRRLTGRGQHVDVSLAEAVCYAASFLLTQWMGGRNRTEREGIKVAGGAQIVTCLDGWVLLAPFSKRSWQSLEIDWMQDPVLSTEPWASDQQYRRANGDVIGALREVFISQFKTWDFVFEAQKRHIPVAPVATPKEYLESEQVQARGLIVESTHPVVGTYKHVRGPFIPNETPWDTTRHAPLLDEHRAEVLAEAGVKRVTVPSGGAEGRHDRQPLEGIRILDFTRVRAGPMGTNILADFGAEVIKIESATIDTFRRGRAQEGFDGLNRNKKSIQLNMKNAKAKQLFFELVKKSDVVVENFTYKVMDDLGIGYDELKKHNPRIILVGMPPLGKTGPYAPWTTYGQQLFSFSGMCYLWAHPESPMESRSKIAYADDTSAPQMVFAMLAALEYRDRAGKGQYVEIAQCEGLAYMMNPVYMDYFINGRVWEPRGNWHPVAAPHGAYKCLGHEAWLAISCETEEHWQALTRYLDNPDLLTDPRFATREARQKNRIALDEVIEKTTSEQTPRQAMWLAQRAGVPAHECSTNEDLFDDPHKRERGFVRHGSFPGWPKADLRGPAVILSETPGVIRTGEPVEGEHNYQVFNEVLGLTRAQIDQLTADKVIY